MSSFKLIEKIGQGSYSRVYKAVSPTSSKILAVKIINFKDAPLEYIQSRQLKLLKECSHPNIASVLDCIKTQQALYLVFDYFPMNLNQYYRYHQKIAQEQLSERQIRKIMTQICSGLAYLHSKGIMHRDVKPQNIMVDPSTLNIKLIDFGFAKYLKKNPHTDYMVTRWYRPLEIVLGMQYDQKIDVFGAAAIYLELIQGYQIFQSESNTDQLHQLLRICGYPSKNSKTYKILQKLGIMDCGKEAELPSLLTKISEPLGQILKSMLDNTPERRPSIVRLLNYLQADTEQRQVPSLQTKKRSRSVANGLSLVSLRCNSKGRKMKEQLQETNCLEQTNESVLRGEKGFCQLVG